MSRWSEDSMHRGSSSAQRQRVVHRGFLPADPFDQVDAAEELPQFQVGGIGGRHEVDDFHGVGLGVPAGELVGDVAVHGAVGVVVQGAP